jgi:hypothetical protein
LKGLEIETVATFYGNFEYFTTIWYNSQRFGIVCGHLVYFSDFVCLDQEKSGNPGNESVGSVFLCKDFLRHLYQVGAHRWRLPVSRQILMNAVASDINSFAYPCWCEIGTKEEC